MTPVAREKKNTGARVRHWANRDTELARKAEYRRTHKDAAHQYNKSYRATNRDAEKMRHAKARAVRRNNVYATLDTRLSAAKHRARRLKLPFNLTKQDLYDLYDAAPRCAVSKLPFDLFNEYSTISIDRIVPAKGYVVGNVRLVWFLVNEAMHTWGEAPLRKVAAALVAQPQTEIQPSLLL